MAKIIWNNENNLGVPEIDKQHQHLCQLFNDINDSMENGRGLLVYKDAVKTMLEYANVHFKKEEDLMRAADFNGLEEHLSEHEFFKNKVKEFDLKADDNREIYETIKIVNFLWDWFQSHIQKTDHKYLTILK